jgi:hypothetical protein
METAIRAAHEAPPVALSEGPLGEVQAADRELARQTALRAKAVARFAATRPASADRAQGEPGAMSPERWAARPEVLRPVSEWAAQELVVALSISEQAAEALLTRSLTLVHRLPGTLAALEAGALHPGHLWPMLEKVAPVEDPTIRAAVEDELLRWAAGRVTTPSQLGAKARRILLARNARSAAGRLAKAVAERGVHLRPESTDGMATVTAVLTMPEAQALYRALAALADGLDDGDGDGDGDPRTRGQKMADCLMDLVLRPGESDLPPVQVLLTAVAPVAALLGGDAAVEIDGHVVPAEMLRSLLRALCGTEQAPAPSGTVAGDAWQQVEQDELARWLDEVERRLLAGELDDEAERCPAEGEQVTADQFPDTVEELLGRDGTQGAADEPADDRAGEPATGWWAAADEAVDDAGRAVRHATEALGNAGRLVSTARRADELDEDGFRTSAAGRVTDAPDVLTVLAVATGGQREWLAALLSATGGGGLAERPRIALTDALSGALLALTDLPELRRAGTCGAPACRRNPENCTHDLSDRPGLGPPGPTDGYRPSVQLDRWVRARDRRCRFPGCRRRVPRGGELDHDRRYPDGPTSADNLTGFCTPHHRGKHQAPGWRYELAPDGTLTVVTPTGLIAATTPPPY